ncbi:hypothetical protein EDD18DRAFT_292777 [Armillaria luteobubalina]|uniref:Lipoprotein n=1 Tax=Armillaria luteobubalina TaxID=153913 RepID=A0AA39UM66_9AGAR|nr:hypothetical protein EDD18DRAFT_292777 [Armillaria luteobubalina]
MKVSRVLLRYVLLSSGFPLLLLSLAACSCWFSEGFGDSLLNQTQRSHLTTSEASLPACTIGAGILATPLDTDYNGQTIEADFRLMMNCQGLFVSINNGSVVLNSGPQIQIPAISLVPSFLNALPKRLDHR